MKQLFEQWFDDARKEYREASRNAFLIVAFLLILQLTTVEQYLEIEPKMRAAQKAATEASELKVQCEQATGASQKVKALLETNLVAELKNWTMNLQDTFHALNKEILAIKNQDRESHASMTAQTARVQHAQILPPDLQSRVRDLNDSKAIQDAVSPTVRASIVEPAFVELNRDWQERFRPALLEQLALISNSVGALEVTDGRSTNVTGLGNSIEMARSNLFAIQFKAPSDDHWWRSVEGKESAATEIAKDVSGQISGKIPQDKINQLTDKAKQISENMEKIAAQTEASVKELEKQFETQSKHAEDLAKTLAFFTLDLKHVVRWFPLFLGLGLGSAMGWSAFRKLELARAYRVWRQADPEIGKWGHLVAPKPTIALVLLGSGGVALLWVVLTAFRISRIQDTQGHGWPMLLFVGPVIAAVIYSIWANNQIRSVSMEPPNRN